MSTHLHEKPRHKLHDRRSSDVIRPILRWFEMADGETLITANDVVTLRMELREAYKVVRELENEVSAKRWNELAAFDDATNEYETYVQLLEALHAPNVIMFPEKNDE